MWEGIITQTMGDIQEYVYRNHNGRNHLIGTIWIRRIIESFIVYFETILPFRNGWIHGKKMAWKKKVKCEKTDRNWRRNTTLPTKTKRSYRERGKMIVETAKRNTMKICISIVNDLQTYHNYRLEQQKNSEDIYLRTWKQTFHVIRKFNTDIKYRNESRTKIRKLRKSQRPNQVIFPKKIEQNSHHLNIK